MFWGGGEEFAQCVDIFFVKKKFQAKTFKGKNK
jgi:hypothetical protein